MTQTFGHYLAVVEVRNAELDAVEVDLADWCARPPLAWQVARLAAYRGVTRLGALTLAAEWRRFAHASQFMGFCGLVPSEYSSGNTVHRGRLTKAGNAHLRAHWSSRPGPTNTVPLLAGRSPTITRAWIPRWSRARGRHSSAGVAASASWPLARTPRASPPPSPGSSPGSGGPR